MSVAMMIFSIHWYSTASSSSSSGSRSSSEASWPCVPSVSLPLSDPSSGSASDPSPVPCSVPSPTAPYNGFCCRNRPPTFLGTEGSPAPLPARTFHPFPMSPPCLVRFLSYTQTTSPTVQMRPSPEMPVHMSAACSISSSPLPLFSSYRTCLLYTSDAADD